MGGGTNDQEIAVRIHALIEAMPNANEDIRCEAGEMLVRIGQPAIPYLVEAAKGSDEKLRECAFLTLIMMDEKALPAIAQLMKSEDRFVKLGAMTAMLLLQTKIKDRQMDGEAVDAGRFSKRPVKPEAAPMEKRRMA